MDRGEIMKTKKYFLNLLKSSQGFSLAEVLVALSVLSIGLIGVAGMQIMSVSGNSFGREMQMAILAGQDLVESIQSLDSMDDDLSEGYHDEDNDEDDLAHVVAPDPSSPGFQFTREWNVDNNNPFPGAQVITVTISWNNSSGEHSIEMITARRI
jgi:prepilin-type N-terminal cleavage/methylation domain-containing protein